MRESMAHWGKDGVRLWSGGAATLAQCVLADTPESVRERLPAAVDPSGEVWFTGQGRLDNRDDLLRSLGPRARDEVVTDGDLLRMAYARWGLDCVQRALGDWAFAAWHVRDRRLVLARDHIGTTSLYYVRSHRWAAFASDRRALLVLPQTPRRLNEYYLAQQLVMSVAEVSGAAETVWRDVQRLPPAHTAIIDETGARLSRYWRLEDAPDVCLRSQADYAEALEDHLARAVRVRLRSRLPMAATLSAGLDSGSVSVLAADELRLKGHSLLALTSVPLHEVAVPGKLADESGIAAVVAGSRANIQHERVDASSIGPLEGLRRHLAYHGEPGLAVHNMYWHLAVFERASGHVLLTGGFGNSALSWAGLPALANIAAALGRGWGRQALVAARDVLRPWLGPAWRVVQGRPAVPVPAVWFPELLARTDLLDRIRTDMARAARTPRVRSGRAVRLAGLRPWRSPTGEVMAELAAEAGLAIREPARDVELLSFLHGIPDRYWRGPMKRWLIRSAMKGKLPDEARLATVRGWQAADLARRLQSTPRELSALLDEVRGSSLARAWLSTDALERLARRVDSSGTSADDLGIPAMMLLRGLCAGRFLAQTEAEL